MIGPGHAKALEEGQISKLSAELRPVLAEWGYYDVQLAPRLARFLHDTYGVEAKDG